MVKKKGCMKPHVVVFVEGDTDYVLFGALLRYYASASKSPVCSYEIHNMKGVARYNAKFFGKLKNEIIPKAITKGRVITAVCCSYDTDVFEYNEHPVVNWTSIRKSVTKLGVSNFCEVKVQSMIEDWLLDDIQGLCSAIGIKEIPELPQGTSGLEKMQKLFRKAGILYHKGFDISKYIGSLDLCIIRSKRAAALKNLENALGFEI